MNNTIYKNEFLTNIIEKHINTNKNFNDFIMSPRTYGKSLFVQNYSLKDYRKIKLKITLGVENDNTDCSN